MAAVRSRPVRRSAEPRYPTRVEALADPDLLRLHIPPSWLSRKEMAGLLGVFLAVNGGGCSKEPSSGPSTRPAGNDLVGKAAIVAPIFEHGDGRGVDGCMVINPPVFLSEQEALQVIREELGQAGLSFSQADTPMEGVSIPLRIETRREDWITGRTGLTAKPSGRDARPLRLDLRDSAHGVGVEFVSQSDCGEMRTDHDDSTGTITWSSVHEYDFKSTANWISKCANEQGRSLRLGVFYDPLERSKPRTDSRQTSRPPGGLDDVEAMKAALLEIESILKMTREERLVESKRLLREQVKDFVDWLKGQGVI